MKRVILYLFLIFSFQTVSAQAFITLSDTQRIEFFYDSETPDIYVNSYIDKLIDSYKIESVGPDCKIISVFTDSINDRNILFTEIQLGNPGGRQDLDLKNLYIFEILKNGKLRLIAEEELVNICYSASKKDFTSLKSFLYMYNHQTKEIIIYNIENYEFICQKKLLMKKILE